MQILKVNGREYDVTPTEIVPQVEIIKKAERSISGRMCIDYISEKINLELIWNVVTPEELERIKTDFVNGGASVAISYLGVESGEDARQYYFDAITYTPVIVNDALKWKDVSVTMVAV